MSKIYPDSGVEVQGLVARHYDLIMNVMSLGLYPKFIRSTVARMGIQPKDRILDLGCGTGRNTRLMHQHLDGDGHILGLDISPIMEKQYKKNCRDLPNVEFRRQRADVPFSLDQPYDKAWMSFVLHGFPHEIRSQIIKNIYDNLKPGGILCILDFAEFSLAKMPIAYRIPFKAIECKYAFDFIERDWKDILGTHGFGEFEEHFWFKNYVRLFVGKKDD